jgi:endonuclease/exonuclease/phosphatase family metal-dependent hydrolase
MRKLARKTTSMPSFTLLSVNLGNAEARYFNERQKNKLASRLTEWRLQRRIRKLRPDIVVYQESIGCLEYAGRDPKNPQIQRLLGADYSILTDNRSQFDGIAVHTHAGAITDCMAGQYRLNPRTEQQGNACDQGFSSQAATIRLKDGFTFDLGGFHLHSTNTECRENTLLNMFTGDANRQKSALLQGKRILIAGDFNLDPWRQNDRSEQVFRDVLARGWEGRKLTVHNRHGTDGRPELTNLFPLLDRSIDIVASNFASGTLDTLGITPGTKRLDGGRGCDHRALFGSLDYTLP